MKLRIPALIRWLALFVALSVAVPTQAQETVPGADAAAIQQVIRSQLEAFQADDWQRAFGFASPTIQTRFVSPEIFSQMVRSGYQPVYRPKGVEFREIKPGQSGPTQEVFVVGPDGLSYLAFYTMELQPDGTWRISGCYLVRAQDESV